MAKPVDKNLKYTLATHAVERMVPSKEAVQLCRENAEGRINADTAVKLIKQKYGVDSRNVNG